MKLATVNGYDADMMIEYKPVALPSMASTSNQQKYRANNGIDWRAVTVDMGINPKRRALKQQRLALMTA